MPTGRWQCAVTAVIVALLDVRTGIAGPSPPLPRSRREPAATPAYPTGKGALLPTPVGKPVFPVRTPVPVIRHVRPASAYCSLKYRRDTARKRPDGDEQHPITNRLRPYASRCRKWALPPGWTGFMPRRSQLPGHLGAEHRRAPAPRPGPDRWPPLGGTPERPRVGWSGRLAFAAASDGYCRQPAGRPVASVSSLC